MEKGKRFQAAQLTHERFLTINHSCKIFFWYLPNWIYTVLMYSATHQRLVEVQFGRYQKNILQEWSMVKNLSCVSCAAWNVSPLYLLLTDSSFNSVVKCFIFDFMKIWEWQYIATKMTAWYHWTFWLLGIKRIFS